MVWRALGRGTTIDRDTVSAIARAVRGRAGARAFPSPNDLARPLDLELRVVRSLPSRCVVAPRIALVRRGPDAREQGWSAFLAIAHTALEQYRGAHSEEEAIALALELAAPGSATRALRLSEIKRRQRRVPAWVFRAARIR